MNKENKHKEESVKATLFTSQHPDIIVSKKQGTIAKSIAILLLGIALGFAMNLVREYSPAGATCLLIACAAFIIYGLYLLSNKSALRTYRPTGSEIQEKSLFFHSKQKDILLYCLEHGDFYTDQELNQATSNGSIRLDIMRSADGRFAGAQLMEFVPYNFQPASPVYYFEGHQALDLCYFIAQVKG